MCKEKLELLVKQFEKQAEDLQKECSIARRCNYQIEAIHLDEKYKLVRDIALQIRMKIIDEILPV